MPRPMRNPGLRINSALKPQSALTMGSIGTHDCSEGSEVDPVDQKRERKIWIGSSTQKCSSLVFAAVSTLLI